MSFKYRIFLKTTVFTLIMALALMFISTSFSITANANEDNKNSFSGENTGTTSTGGASSTKSGYLAYIVDKNGNLVSEVAFLYWSGYYPSGYNTDYTTSAFGNVSPTIQMQIDTSYPRPYTVASDGSHVGQGTRLAEKLATPDSTNTTGAAYLINDIWGEDMVDIYRSGNHYLIMEGVWWIGLDKVGGEGTSTPLEDKAYCATAKGWAQLFKDYNYEPARSLGATYTNVWYCKLTNMTYDICMTFSYSMLGLDPACLTDASGNNYIEVQSTKGNYNVFPNSYILSDVAAGMIVVWKDGDTQTTNDETLSVEHSAPDESTGTYRIVKNYVSQMTAADGTITYNDEGCYTKVDSAAEISIEDESSNTGYTLMQWYATDSSDTSVTSVSNNSLVWDSNVPGTKTVGGTQEHTINLEDYGSSKTVYLLLMKSDEEEVEKEDGVNFTISESAVTRRVSFSEDEDGVTDLK